MSSRLVLLVLLALAPLARAQAPAPAPAKPAAPDLAPSSEAGDTAALDRDIGPLKDRIPPVTGHTFLMLSNGLRQLKDVTDWQQYGGAPILGFDRLFIKAHGRSRARAIANAGKVAAKAVTSDLARAIREGLTPAS